MVAQGSTARPRQECRQFVRAEIDGDGVRRATREADRGHELLQIPEIKPRDHCSGPTSPVTATHHRTEKSPHRRTPANAREPPQGLLAAGRSLRGRRPMSLRPGTGVGRHRAKEASRTSTFRPVRIGAAPAGASPHVLTEVSRAVRATRARDKRRRHASLSDHHRCGGHHV